MRCGQCKQEAAGVCQFCGAGVCPDHRKQGRFVSGWRSTGQGGWGRFPTTSSDYVVVADAGFCGRCHVQVVQE